MKNLVSLWPIALFGVVLSSVACGGDDESGGSGSVGTGGATAGAAGRPTFPGGIPPQPAAGSPAPPAAAAGSAAPANPTPGRPVTPPPTSAAGSGAPPVTPPPVTPPVMMMPPPAAPPAGPPGTWPAADPATKGPFATVMESNVGPGMAFTMWRPMMLTQKHPVITWGNGTGTTPPVYRTGLDLYASHGFIVIASNSENVAQGTPPPMLQGVTWVLEQDMTDGAPLYQHVDRDHVGATGHSQGAFAASSAGGDPVIKAVAPIESLGGRRFNGPVLGLCGTMDTVVPCSGNLSSFMGVSNQPAMYAELKEADHMNWIFGGGGTSPFWVISNAWFRVHLMGDTALRPMFYGPDCGYCKDDAWVIMRSMMDN